MKENKIMDRIEVYTIECEEEKKIDLFNMLIEKGVTYMQLLNYIIKYNGKFFLPHELKHFNIQNDIVITISNYYQTINIIDLT